MDRLTFVCLRTLAGFAFALCLASAYAQDVANEPQGEQIPGPTCGGYPDWTNRSIRTCQPGDFAFWLSDVQHWRAERRDRVGLFPDQYQRPEFKWAQSSFIQPQMMAHDRFFFDAASGKYTVQKYLDDLRKRYGGIDSVLIWHTYPNIGIDDRNQFDLFQDLPGGVEGVRAMVDEFHRNGVRVMFPLMVWDRGTREESQPVWEAITSELAAVGADGINGDTLGGVPQAFLAASDKAGRPLVFEPENGVDSDEMLNYNVMSWGYWNHSFVPAISRYKWLESRHMVNVCSRWAHDHLEDLQFAFFNGVGFESWENIWGIWNQLTPRDAELLTRVAAIERANAELLVSPDWHPHFPTQQFGIFASQWPGKGRTLWTLVNRNQYPVAGVQLVIPAVPGARYFDLWNGVELTPKVNGTSTALEFTIEASGFGAILETNEPSAKDTELLSTMKARAEKPISSFSSRWQVLPQQIVDIAPTKPASSAPQGMIRIPESDFEFRVNGIEIEGGDDDGVDVQYPTEPSPRRYHNLRMHIKSFWIDKYEVTNEDFKKFIDQTHYTPADPHNFLRDWKNGTYPEGWAKKPVTWVSIEDARAYARWAGKRLPHEWEWQYAAQGTDGRPFPWGNCDWLLYANEPSNGNGAACSWGPDPRNAPAPIQDKGRTMLPPADVDAHPNGASPFGVMDMVGNVWQWTDEFGDAHTRTAILRGGSHYRPQGSGWYFPQAYRLNEHGKYLLMGPSLDRSAAVGFRCVRDAQ